jgi:hypothetical protein
LDDTELVISGIDALNRALGAADAYRFMTLLHNEKTDYVEISRRLYDGQSIDDIFSRAKTEWDG